MLLEGYTCNFEVVAGKAISKIVQYFLGFQISRNLKINEIVKLIERKPNIEAKRRRGVPNPKVAWA